MRLSALKPSSVQNVVIVTMSSFDNEFRVEGRVPLSIVVNIGAHLTLERAVLVALSATVFLASRSVARA